ncbi:glycoside hydrolase family 3 C-terminal domain-containing protein [Actinoalloteichus sp. GBA129-24]|uniref:glycoside hydrolase family 3 C-terminal domain-containing protein n=1 Tax=Actinoalloteichus sp. GBA129-24 TaxID=1612551 RepID=UPI0009506B61|nr:glycoside hydrolase family 3 C-terminal domain-containing protein [Actinoalloteichus sp. GBA129-24]APU19482.1 exo-1,4-beta-glucosidase [Actinoalloteichus sp. GBA129-24]
MSPDQPDDSTEGRPAAPPHLDPALPPDRRIAALLSLLDLDTRLLMLHQFQPAVPSAGLASFHTGMEALHGLAWVGPATVFPQAVGLGATWNPELLRRVGSATGDEVRGFHHRDPVNGGLNVWAPVVNLLRDPRWGRNEEGYAEDPLLTGVLSVAYASGLRGDHPRYLKTAPTLKHFLGYNNETDRDTTSSDLRARVLHEYELPAFRAAIASGAAVGVMPSYNLVNGRPAHTDGELLGMLRSWADDEIVVCSDAHAPSNIAGVQGYHPDQPTGHAAALLAGVDSFTDHDTDSEFTAGQLREALRRGLITEADVDRALRRLLLLRLRLGEFDPAPAAVTTGSDSSAGGGAGAADAINPYALITDAVIDSPAHRELAREAAREAVVLLRNENELLPLRRADIRRIAVIGTHADVLYEDWYSGTLPYQVTPAGGLAAASDADVVADEGVDRISLVSADGRLVGAGPAAEGGALRLLDAVEATGVDGDRCRFDLIDWGEGVQTLRSAANARYVSARADGSLVNDRVMPGEWVVHETFEIQQAGSGRVRLFNRALARWVRVDADGVLRADVAEGHSDTEDRKSAGDQQTTGTAFTIHVDRRGVETAVETASGADVAVIVIGNDPHINGRETEDRVRLELPAAQEELVRRVGAANPRTVLVIVSSYPVAIPWADRNLAAVLWTAHGGQEAGTALAEVLFGDYSPAGRLPQTWYRATTDLPDLLDYDIISSGSTYLYYRGRPLYPFGHGLSYTEFHYGPLELDAAQACPDDTVTARVTVTNVGRRSGDEVVQLYSRQEESRAVQPVLALRAFQRLHLATGESETVEFPVSVRDLALFDVTSSRMVVETSRHRLSVGASSADLRSHAELDVLGEVVGPLILAGRRVRAVDFDAVHGIRLVDETRTEGTAVHAAESGAWAAFHRVVLPVGPLRCTVSAARDDTKSSVIQLRIGDPVGGAVLAELVVTGEGDRRVFRDVVADAEWPVRGPQPVAAGATGLGAAAVIAELPSRRLAGQGRHPGREPDSAPPEPVDLYLVLVDEGTTVTGLRIEPLERPID